MTDPLEDRLRSHLADRAARVTVDPDPAGVVERSAGRRRVGAPLAAAVAAVVALVAAGGFATGAAVAGSSPTDSPPTTTLPGSASLPVSNGASSALAPAVGSGAGTAQANPLSALFTRTTGGGVTIRTYVSSTQPDTGCSGVDLCAPPPVTCPKTAVCAQPAGTRTSPGGGAAATGGAGGSTGSGTTGVRSVPPTTGTVPTTSGSVPPTTGTVPTSTTTTTTTATSTTTTTTGTSPVTTGTSPVTTVPPVRSGCQQLTLELSTAQAVWSDSLSSPTAATLGTGTVQLLGTGSFGGPEGAPVGYVAVVVSADVTSVQLVSSGGVLDSMVPSSGVAVLATTGVTGLGGTTVVGLDAAGTKVGTVPADQGTTSVSGCAGVVPGHPTTPPTTTPPVVGPTVPPGGATASTVVPPASIQPAVRMP